MQAMMQLLGIAIISVSWVGCRDVPRFGGPDPESARLGGVQSKPALSTESNPEEEQALEPTPIGGAYLVCRYEVVKDNGEIWCRLEENSAPKRVASQPASENWTIMQGTTPVGLVPQTLDPTTGWQWSLKMPQGMDVDISLEIWIDAAHYHYNATVPTTPSPDGSALSLTHRYSYGERATFMLDSAPLAAAEPPSCVTESAPVPTANFAEIGTLLRAQSFTFPFEVERENTQLTITMESICGQSKPIHFAEIRGMGISMMVAIPVDAKRAVIARNQALPVGEYEIFVHTVPRGVQDRVLTERLAFGSLLFESNARLDLDAAKSQ